MMIEVGLQNKVSHLVNPLKHNSVLCMKIKPISVSDNDKATPVQETSIRVTQEHTNTRIIILVCNKLDAQFLQ